MSRTKRCKRVSYAWVDFPNKKVHRDGKYSFRLRSNKCMKRSTRKLIKLSQEDVWDIPNTDKLGRQIR